MYHHKQSPKPTNRPSLVDGEVAEEIRQLILQYPTFGYRRIWAMLRRRLGMRISRKKVYRIMKLQGWLMHQRQKTPRPRGKGKRSTAKRSNER